MAISGYTLFSIFVLSFFASSIRSQQTETKEFMLTLDHTNFTETINNHVFIVVNFYESWCKNCKELAYEYEKAASELNSHVPPVVLAKFDASTERNKELANGYKITYFPTIKIFRYGGKLLESYNGPNKAENIELHLKRQSKKPIPSLEIKSVDDATKIVTDEEIVVVGIFPKLSGSEFNSFLMIAHNLGSDYDFAHTLDAKLLPRGESSVTGPIVRLFKPFDEFVDFKDFDEKALEKFVKESSFPLVTVLDKDPNNNPFVNMPYAKSMTGKVMLIMNFTGEAAESLKSKYREVATSNKGQGLRFLLGDSEASQDTLKFFGHRESQIPLIIIETYKLNYLKPNVEVNQIESWVNDFKDGKLVPHKKASLEMKSAYDIAADVIVDNISDNKVVVVGIFPKLSGPEFDSFLATAEKMRAEFDFVHTSNLKFFPRKEPFLTGPIVRILKPFVEYFADFNDFNVEALEKFVKESSIPLITVFDKNYPNNQPYVIKFFESSRIKVMLYMNFTGEGAESLKSKYREVATSNKGHGLSFLLGNAENTQDVFEFYGLNESQVPLIIIQTIDKKKYLKENVEVNQIESWVNDFKDGKLVVYTKSQPIPTVNNEPVKVVVSKSLDDMVFNSGKNVLLEFYDPKCGPCQNIAPILDEVAVSYQSDQSIVIAKLDITANDFPRDIFNAKSVPSIYFRSTSGNIVVYEGHKTKEDIISFIDKYKDKVGELKTEAKDEL